MAEKSDKRYSNAMVGGGVLGLGTSVGLLARGSYLHGDAVRSFANLRGRRLFHDSRLRGYREILSSSKKDLRRYLDNLRKYKIRDNRYQRISNIQTLSQIIKCTRNS